MCYRICAAELQTRGKAAVNANNPQQSNNTMKNEQNAGRINNELSTRNKRRVTHVKLKNYE